MDILIKGDNLIKEENLIKEGILIIIKEDILAIIKEDSLITEDLDWMVHIIIRSLYQNLGTKEKIINKNKNNTWILMNYSGSLITLKPKNSMNLP